MFAAANRQLQMLYSAQRRPLSLLEPNRLKSGSSEQVFIDDVCAATAATAPSGAKSYPQKPVPQPQLQPPVTESNSEPQQQPPVAESNSELQENRALLHRVLREKQQLLVRCCEQQRALKAAAAHTTILQDEVASLEAELGVALQTRQASVVLPTATKDQLPGRGEAGLTTGASPPVSASPPPPGSCAGMAQPAAAPPAAAPPAAALPPAAYPAAAYPAAACPAATYPAAACLAEDRAATTVMAVATDAQRRLIEETAREALERALVGRSRECEELELCVRFKEAALQHQVCVHTSAPALGESASSNPSPNANPRLNPYPYASPDHPNAAGRDGASRSRAPCASAALAAIGHLAPFQPGRRHEAVSRYALCGRSSSLSPSPSPTPTPLTSHLSPTPTPTPSPTPTSTPAGAHERLGRIPRTSRGNLPGDRRCTQAGTHTHTCMHTHQS